jgi:hypothetical protein
VSGRNASSLSLQCDWLQQRSEFYDSTYCSAHFQGIDRSTCNQKFFFQENITVTILDSNDKPSAIEPNSTSVDENTRGNTFIVFEVFDEDRNQKHSCFVEDSKFFEINNADSRSILWVKNGAVLDYEKNDSLIPSKFAFSQNLFEPVWARLF